MKHRHLGRKLGRTPSHRRALLRNLATALVLHERIETTLPKAKELKRVADKLVTLGKKKTLHAQRVALGYLNPIFREVEGNTKKNTAVHKLFTIISPRYSERKGGYTRVVRSRIRQGDKAQLAFVEFVEEAVRVKEKKKRRVVRKTAKTKPEAATEQQAGA